MRTADERFEHFSNYKREEILSEFRLEMRMQVQMENFRRTEQGTSGRKP